MDELLERVLDTHGGLKKWWKALGASLQLTVDGPFWAPGAGRGSAARRSSPSTPAG